MSLSLLLCPVDRNVIDVTKVCDETGLRRTISCLEVKCGSHDVGCEWEGQLSDLNSHLEQCQHMRGLQQPQQHLQIGELVNMVAELRSRMDCYEARLEEKDKELAHVKMKWKEDVDALKQYNVETKELLQHLTQENAEIKIEVNNLKKEREESKITSQLTEDESQTNITTKKHVPSKATPSPALVHAKNIELLSKIAAEKLLQLYRGPADVVFGDDFHLNFGEEKTVLGLPTLPVCLGDKIYFEVTCTDIWEKGTCGFRWACQDFKPSIESVEFAYKIHGVKWYFPNGECCYEGGNNVSPYDD